MNALALAQSSGHTPAFLSLGLGPFWTDRSGFAETYGSSTVLAGAGGFGLPVARHVHAYGKVTYIARKSLDETEKFKQWLMDAGLQYSLPLVENIAVAFQGGLAYSVVSEETVEADGSSSCVHGSGFLGLFAGLGAERPLDRSSCSLFLEVQYTASRSDVASFVNDYGGLSITLGIRYRFLEDRGSEKDASPPPGIWQE